MKTSLRRRHALIVEEGAFIHKIDYVTVLNLEGHLNCITGSRVTAILPNRRILPVGGASAVEGLQSMGLPCQVFFIIDIRHFLQTMSPSFCIFSH